MISQKKCDHHVCKPDIVKEKKSTIEIGKPIPFKKTNSFEKIYNEYLQTSLNKNLDITASNFDPDNNNSPNYFVNKLENRIKVYYNSFE
tara:strand:- start:214 stop:480 length:267 start_codon:yes stop_codon:yes gene_type:complete